MVYDSAAIPWLIFGAGGIVRAFLNSPENGLSAGAIYFALGLYFLPKNCTSGTLNHTVFSA